ncbi:SRPBCC family protein [Taibaiella koreensis]|uniref:SRPBCC family protein n=1 Tax=Taibaiella koreensis TaxID=1268548 RepID=UPI000E59B4EB|nr:SRPBCC family protein [Taibaiella koreensis]
MKNFFRFLGIVVLLVITFILISGIFISRSYHFERSIVIHAPKEEVWQNISLFANIEKWHPWKAKDPHMTYSISGTDGTVGAVYSWKSNSAAGSGSQTFTRLQPYEHILIDLEFKEPFKSKAKAFYHLQPQGDAVKLTWGFDCKMPYPMNAVFYFFIDMDDRMDKDFSEGLANLKKLCESSTQMTASHTATGRGRCNEAGTALSVFVPEAARNEIF